MTKPTNDSSGIWSHVIAALASGLSIWAIVLALVPRFTDLAVSLTTSVSLASSVVILGVAAYGIGTWQKQERHRPGRDIALRAIEATLGIGKTRLLQECPEQSQGGIPGHNGTKRSMGAGG